MLRPRRDNHSEQKSFLESAMAHWILISIGISFCSWFYCKAYCNALGIPISYNHIDNIIFLFERFLWVEVDPLNENKKQLLYLGTISCAALLYFFRLVYRKTNISKHIPQNPSKGFIIFCEIISIVGVSGYFIYLIETLQIFSVLTFISFVLFFTYLCITLLISNHTAPNRSKRAALILITTLLIFFLPNFFRMIGEADARNLMQDNFADGQVICLAEFPRNIANEPTKFARCGNLLHLNADRICLKIPTLESPFCAPRDKYEISLFPR